MAEIRINTDAIKDCKITEGQFYFLMSLVKGIPKEAIMELVNKKFLLTQGLDGKLYTNKETINIINRVLNNSIPDTGKVDFYALGRKMQELFPKGKKPGTNQYWRGNIGEISNRLKMLFDRYPHISEEEVINATKTYVAGYEHNDTLMRTLKYFISKRDLDGTVHYDLLSYIENEGEDEMEDINARLV